jgi:hypothetical protein
MSNIPYSECYRLYFKNVLQSAEVFNMQFPQPPLMHLSLYSPKEAINHALLSFSFVDKAKLRNLLQNRFELIKNFRKDNEREYVILKLCCNDRLTQWEHRDDERFLKPIILKMNSKFTKL